MITDADREYLARIAWKATVGIVGLDAAVPGGELYDGIHGGLVATVERAYQAGVATSMVQLSLLPDAAHAVG